MLFNSLEFALFFPFVTLVYFLLAHRFRVTWLLVASCAFYMAFVPAYILILFLTILVDYFAGIYLVRLSGRPRKVLLWVSILSTCLILFVFKYFYFATGNFITLAGWLGWQFQNPTLNIILPIGLSFHTFQSLSYVVEVYRGNQQPERNFIVYSTFVMFWPQLVAGPIERPQNLLHQFHEKHVFDYERVVSGLKRMAWGFFKKLVVADRLALYVNDVYANPSAFSGAQLTLATVFFAYQIYCDFSGYSDIAVGSARVMGFKLMENFNTPYYSLSIAEFWRRWHISLSTWFRDYVYYPLGGSRVGKGLWARNIIVTFATSGLWHGAAWTYVIWGFMNGIYIVVGEVTRAARDRAWSSIGVTADSTVRKISMLICTLFLTLCAWVVFRAKSIGDAWYVFTHFFIGWSGAIGTEQFLLRQLPVAVLGILVLELGHLWQRAVPSVPAVLRRLPLVPRWAVYAVFILSVLFFGAYREAQFIYFQF